MACNCKAKEVADAAIEMSGETVDSSCKKNNIFSKIFSFLVRVITALLIGAILSVLVVPFILYMIVCIILGRQPSFNIGKMIKWSSKLNGGD